VLSSEPDGSFIVRDSSDDHYIFSLSFKLNNCVRHVRIEQDQGEFKGDLSWITNVNLNYIWFYGISRNLLLWLVCQIQVTNHHRVH